MLTILPPTMPYPYPMPPVLPMPEIFNSGVFLFVLLTGTLSLVLIGFIVFLLLRPVSYRASQFLRSSYIYLSMLVSLFVLYLSFSDLAAILISKITAGSLSYYLTNEYFLRGIFLRLTLVIVSLAVYAGHCLLYKKSDSIIREMHRTYAGLVLVLTIIWMSLFSLVFIYQLFNLFITRGAFANELLVIPAVYLFTTLLVFLWEYWERSS